MQNGVKGLELIEKALKWELIMSYIFIMGGAYQGKLAYVQEYYNISDDDILDFEKSDIDRENDVGENAKKNKEDVVEKWLTDSVKDKKCFYHCHLFVKWAVKNGVDVISTWEKIVSLLCESEDCYVIMDEIGNGIIPLDRFERNYREQAGIFGCYLARRADEVIRVICGIGNRIK